MELIFSVVGGLVVALVLQLLLANFGLALGLTVLDWSPDDSPDDSPDSSDSSALKQRTSDNKTQSTTASSEFSLPVTHLLGFGVAASLSLVIFAASLLATEFSQILDPRRGIIFGLIFWATYWLLFIWLSSSTAVSIADSVLGSAIAGGRQLISTLQQLLPDENPSKEGNLAVAQQSLIKNLAAEISQVADVQQALPELLAQQKDMLLAEIGDRTQLSSEQIADLLKHIKPTEQASSKSTALDGVSDSSPDSSPTLTSSSPISIVQPNLLAQLDLPDWKQMLGKVLDGQIDLSDLSARGLWQQIPELSDSNKIKSAHKTIQQVAEAYLRYAPSWALQPEALQEAFTEQIHVSTVISEMIPEQISAQLSTLDHDHFVDWLQKRKDLSKERVEAIASQLSNVPSKLAAALSFDQEEAEEQQTEPKMEQSAESKVIQEKLIAYCRYTNLDILTPTGLTEKIQSQLQEHCISTTSNLSIDIDAISDVLSRRNKITPAKSEFLIKTLKSALSAKISETSHQAQSVKEASAITVHAARSLPEQLSSQFSRYLRYQEKSAFHPEQIAKDVTQIVSQVLRGALSSLLHPSALLDLFQDSELEIQFWDKSLWENELIKRRDMTTDEIQQILEWGESASKPIAQKIGAWIEVVQHKASELGQLPEGHLESVFLEKARQQIVEQISIAQTRLKDQADAVKADVQRRADAVKGQIEIATWWLFTALLLSGIAAGSAGWLAAVY
ncbi:MAG: Bacterial protein of unknown function (DUF883) [Phormidesmis priestleyi Ana]|uniref:Uncharacterized protein n=1 Tax=Phormidesmis priestleyi Ana TaxID=1666911 RepID=A0A0N8KMF1_9CYAN|nr:MAG: Bacterial protein of unknown function (DUF883) [Phormidesmis priestleyi Ana]